ncbi:MAG: DNA adenine methylase, partial [Bacteroidetes bacterium]
MKAPQPIPYQGSKRALAPLILNYFPDNVSRLIEPFAGSAAVSVAAAMRNKIERFLINDINSALIDLFREIVENPNDISSKYEKLWNQQLGIEKEFFVQIREKFNISHRPDHFLYVLARCIKGAIRYNTKGEFNQSADNRRKGKSPKNMAQEIAQVSQYLKGKSEFFSIDYFEVFKMATEEDLIY